MSAELRCMADDVVSLGKRTDFDSTIWLFPDTNQCPLKKCLLSCASRDEALNHFRMHHADVTMPCSICGEIVSTENSQNLLRHYKDVHPNAPQPKLKKATTAPLLIELKKDAPQSSIDCWSCGKGKTNIQCSKCKCSFHKKCAKNYLGKNWVCDECKEVVFKPFDIKFIPFILTSMVEKFTTLSNLQFNSEQTQHAIDIPQMQQKSYGTVEQFGDDIKWLKRNCRLIHPDDSQIQLASKRLTAFVKRQIEDILVCGECYENDCKFGEKSLVMPCSQPHLLVWSQRQMGCYLPAKVMAVNTEQNEATVRFFDDKTREFTRVTSSYLYSREYPLKKYDRKCDAVIKTANVYIENIRLKFGHYNFAKHGAEFHPEKLQEYLKRMIAANPSTDFNGNAFSASGMDPNATVGETVNKIDRIPPPPKRSGSKSSSSAASAKKIRNQNEVGSSRSVVNPGIGQAELQSSTSNYLQANKLRIGKAADGIAHELQVYNQIFCDNTKKIEQLQADLVKLNKKTQDLEQKKVALERMVDDSIKEKQKMSDEKKESEERYVALVNATNEVKEKIENENKILMEKNGALEMEMQKLDGEKKALEQKVEELERFKNQIYQLAKPPQ